MATVSYTHQFDYVHHEDGGRHPQLSFRVSSLENPALVVDIDASIDSGAERSLMDGQVAVLLGLDVLDGSKLTFETMAGSYLSSTLHTIQLAHADLGTFQMEVAFSAGKIRRNLLGRDFFDLVQIGFREHHLTFFVTPAP